MAAAGVPKTEADALGRWGPDGSEVYVRTYRNTVRRLLDRFVSVCRDKDAFATLDEEDALRTAEKRMAKFDVSAAELDDQRPRSERRKPRRSSKRKSGQAE